MARTTARTTAGTTTRTTTRTADGIRAHTTAPDRVGGSLCSLLASAILVSSAILSAIGLPGVLWAEASAAAANEGASITAASDATSPAPVNSAKSVIEALHATLLEAMKGADELGFQGRFDLIAPAVTTAFDLDFMGSKCVGRHWLKLTDEEKAAWLESFTRLTTANYAGRFTGYDGESFITLGQEPGARETTVVLTKIKIPSDEDVLLNYRMIEKGGRWRIIDVYLNGTVSELALRRSEYSTTLKRDGFDKLAAAVDQKIQELQEKGG